MAKFTKQPPGELDLTPEAFSAEEPKALDPLKKIKTSEPEKFNQNENEKSEN